jgi:hypothetical protein
MSEKSILKYAAKISRLNDRISLLSAENSLYRKALESCPCMRMVVQDQPYAECFPDTPCLGCDCPREALVSTEPAPVEKGRGQ